MSFAADDKCIRIGKFYVGRVWLAPMAGYTDIAFRQLCRERGAGLAVSEMVSVRGLVRGNATTDILTRRAENEDVFCLQLFGNDPQEFARAAEQVDCDIIDVNMGCPMPKIVKNGDGSALLKTPALAGDVVRAIKSATDKPVTVKTRIGWSEGIGLAGELIARVADAGAAAVTVHGRYAEQRYAGQSDTDAVRKLAESANIPVIVNGDISEDGIADLLCEFPAVAVGRAALKNPSLFCGGQADPFETAERHIELLCKYFDARYTVNQARKFFVHYFKGVRGGKTIRDAVNRAESVADVLSALGSQCGE